MWFSDFHKRWMTADESMTCQGFPIYREWSYNEVCCTLAKQKAGLSRASPPSRCTAIGQAGNSMHTEVAATMLSYALLEVGISHHARDLFTMRMGARPFRLMAHRVIDVDGEDDEG